MHHRKSCHGEGILLLLHWTPAERNMRSLRQLQRPQSLMRSRGHFEGNLLRQMQNSAFYGITSKNRPARLLLRIQNEKSLSRWNALFLRIASALLIFAP